VSFKERDDLVDLGFYRDLENKYLRLEEDTHE